MLFFITAMMPASGFAADATWDGSDSGLWVTGGNWVGDAAPGGVGTTTNTDTAIFTGGVNNNVTVDNTRNIKYITFNAAADAFTLSGDTLYLTDAGTIQNAAETANTQTIDSNIVLVGGYSFTNNATNNTKLINFDGTITGTTDVIQTLTLSGANTGSNSISGIISDGGGTSTVGITKTGAGTWVLSSANTYTGNTTISAGTLNLNESLATSSLVFSGNGTVNLAADKNITSAITNTSGATAGTLNFLGSSTTGGNIGGSAANTGLAAVNVDAGTLTMNHNIYATTTTVASGATVDISSNNLTLGGAFDMLGTSQLNLAILDSSTSGSLTTTGAADIPVTALVDLNITSGQYIPNSTTFTAVDGTGGVAIIGGNTVTDNNPYVSFTTTGGSDLVLVASRAGTGFDSWATTENSRAAGVSLEDAGSHSPTSDMLSVLGAMEALPTGSIEGVLTQMCPQIDGSIIHTNNIVSTQKIQTITDHLHYNRAGRSSGVSTGDGFTTNTKGVWIKGFGTRANQNARQDIEGYRANVLGTAVGADFITNQNTTIGLGIGYANSRIKAKKSNIGNNTADTLQGAIYYGYDQELNYIPGDILYLNLIGSFGWNTYDASRTVSFGSINRTAKASYDGQQYTAYAEAGYHVPLSSTVDWIPFFSLQYTHLNLDGYTETEADSLNLKVDEQSYDMCEVGLGMKLVSKIRTESFDFMPEIRAQWLYDLKADRMETTSRFTGGGAAFKTIGAKPARHAFDLGGSLTFITSKNITIDFDYDYSFKQDYRSSDASAVLKFGVLLP